MGGRSWWRLRLLWMCGRATGSRDRNRRRLVGAGSSPPPTYFFCPIPIPRQPSLDGSPAQLHARPGTRPPSQLSIRPYLLAPVSPCRTTRPPPPTLSVLLPFPLLRTTLPTPQKPPTTQSLITIWRSPYPPQSCLPSQIVTFILVTAKPNCRLLPTGPGGSET